MKRLNFFFRIRLFVFVMALPLLSFGQMIINSGPEVTPIDMVECILGEGVQYSNVTFQGADISRGIFLNGDSTNIGIDKGVFLTSGAGYIIPGPNNSSSAGVNNGMGGHPTLNALTTSTTYDACVLEFDMIPEYDTLKLTYVFGSEEYSEWVGSTFNDVFGLFVTGPNPLGGYYSDKNIAIVPGTANTYVTINNVNNGYAPGFVVPTGPCINCEFFIDNTGGLTIQYDGFTAVLTAWLLVNPCEEYHLKLGVADAGDHLYDSGVLIAENSITCPMVEVEAHLNPPGIMETMLEGFIDADVVFKLPHVDYSPFTVYLEVTGTTDPSAYPPGDFEEEIPTEVYFAEGEDSVSFHVTPVYDMIIEGEESLIFIVENTLGCVTRYDTAICYIQDYIEMDLNTSPNTMICEGQELDLWVQVYNGLTPYTYYWEPGGYINDTIMVSPGTTTTYYITCTDLTMNSVMDSIMVTVFPFCELESFYFETYLNPGLPYNVFGEVINDTVLVVFPPGTNLNGLIPSLTFSNEECNDAVGTITDFTEPFVYQFLGPGGCTSEWFVVADVEVGLNDQLKNEIQIFPNPAKDQIFISNANESYLVVLNSLGSIVLEKYIESEKVNMDVSNLVEGVYYFKFVKSEEWFIENVLIK